MAAYYNEFDPHAAAWLRELIRSGRSVSLLRASARSTSDSGSGSWPSPTVGNAMGSQAAKGATATGRRPDGSKATVSLNHVATLATQDAASSGSRDYSTDSGRHSGTTLTDAARLAGWATASARDWKDTSGMATTATNPDGSTRTRLDQLPRQAALTTWPSPGAKDGAKSVRTLTGAEKEAERRGWNNDFCTAALSTVTEGPARFTADGRLLTGCSAETGSGGQLNPAHSRWLMGYPPAWDACAVTAMPSSRRSPRK